MAHELIINGELYHYGKKGMKWHKRKAKQVSNSNKNNVDYSHYGAELNMSEKTLKRFNDLHKKYGSYAFSDYNSSESSIGKVYDNPEMNEYKDLLTRVRMRNAIERAISDAKYDGARQAEEKARQSTLSYKVNKKISKAADVIESNGSKAISTLKKGANNVKNNVEQFGKDVKRVYKNNTSPKVTSDGNLKKGKGGVYTYTEKGKAEALKVKAKVDAEMAAKKKKKK